MYKVTIEGISDAKLGEVVAQIGTKKYPVRVTYYEHPDQKDVKLNGRGSKKQGAQDDIVSLTGKGATKGSNREQILHTLEKLEKKHGIGTVTRKMLRAKVVEAGGDSQILYQLIREGYLKTRSAT